MANVRADVEGIDGLRDALRKLGPAARKAAMRAIQRELGRLRSAIDVNIPRDTGALAAGLGPVHVIETERGVRAWVTLESDHAAAIEYGTVDIAPQAPMRRAVDEYGQGAADGVAGSVRDGIERVKG